MTSKYSISYEKTEDRILEKKWIDMRISEVTQQINDIKRKIRQLSDELSIKEMEKSMLINDKKAHQYENNIGKK